MNTNLCSVGECGRWCGGGSGGGRGGVPTQPGGRESQGQDKTGHGRVGQAKQGCRASHDASNKRKS